jgi:hypothetical protein
MPLKHTLLFMFVLVSSRMLYYGQLTRFTSQYKIGYKDAAGTVVVSPKYDAGSDMNEGFAIVMKAGKRGYIDAKGEEVIACQYDDASLFENGLACVQQYGRYGYIDHAGAWAIHPIYENAFSFKAGLARVCKNNKWGMINTQGIVVVPLIYEQLHDISKGLIAASIDGQHFGYINAEGKVMIDFRYSLAAPFDEHRRRALVSLSEKKYYINSKGRKLRRVKANEVEKELKERKERAGARD